MPFINAGADTLKCGSLFTDGGQQRVRTVGSSSLDWLSSGGEREGGGRGDHERPREGKGPRAARRPRGETTSV